MEANMLLTLLILCGMALILLGALCCNVLLGQVLISTLRCPPCGDAPSLESRWFNQPMR
jgi:hypothetical protein